MFEDSVVVLNKYLEYWTDTSIRRAVSKIINNRASVVKEDKSVLLGTIGIGIGTESILQPIYKPLVIKLLYFDYYRYKTDKVNYTDRAVFVRDQGICQYWHNNTQYKCLPSEMTIDHVIPLSRNGKANDFTNAVTCCRNCNEILKKNNTPEEAGLRLIRSPKIPKRIKGDAVRSFFIYNNKSLAHKAYIEFLMGISTDG
jgi:5-methylcytosine-specific restriction endonuclease McrA